MENGTLRMGILKTKGLRSLVQTVFHSQQKCPYATFRFPKFEEFWNNGACKELPARAQVRSYTVMSAGEEMREAELEVA